MSVKIQTKYGAHTITVEGKNLEEAIELLGPIAEFPRTGPKGETDIMLRHRRASGYDFYEIVNEDGQTFSLGQRKDGGGLFPKRDQGWHRYEGGNRDARDDDRTTRVPPRVETHDDDSDLPF